MNSYEKLNSLTDSSVWVFTKQAISFDTAFKAAKLFKEIPNRVNVEEYFASNHMRYGIETDRHRVLVISQLFGLLTKTPLYGKGKGYKTERPTEVFELLNNCEFGGKEYNTLKTEQILKVKIKAIIDTANNNEAWNILPVIFSYKILHELKEKHGIDSVDINLFYTYVMTCKNYSELDEAVEYIRTNSPATKYVKEFKDRSRFITLVQDNLKLFDVKQGKLSLNKLFEEYFYDNFMDKFDIDELNIQLMRDVDYTYFLTTFQNFGINLIDIPERKSFNLATIEVPKIMKKKVAQVSDCIFEDDDTDYVDKVDDVKEYNINEDVGIGAFKNKPNVAVSSMGKRYSKNPIIGKIAIKQAFYKCKINSAHETFISSKTNEQFMEAHHLIPISFQEVIWEKFGVNIDCIENIVSLCPNCHRAIHYAKKEDKIKIIKSAYDLKKMSFQKIGLDISLNEVVELYCK